MLKSLKVLAKKHSTLVCLHVLCGIICLLWFARNIFLLKQLGQIQNALLGGVVRLAQASQNRQHKGVFSTWWQVFGMDTSRPKRQHHGRPDKGQQALAPSFVLPPGLTGRVRRDEQAFVAAAHSAHSNFETCF